MVPLQAKMKSALAHGAMAYLFSLGLALTLLGVTGLLQHGWLAAWMLLLLTGLCAAIGLNRRIALGAGCVALFAAGLWLIIGGAGMLVEVSRRKARGTHRPRLLLRGRHQGIR